MTANEILDAFKALGDDGYKRILLKHGVQEPVFGVKIEEMKKYGKRIKKDHQLALDLYDSGVYDAMYFAGLIADDAAMTKKNLQHWAGGANCPMLRTYTVPWVAAGSSHGWEMALKWIGSKNESIASVGWSTLGSLVGIKEDADLDLPELNRLLEQVRKTILDQPNQVRASMNLFVISVGGYVKSLTATAVRIGEQIGCVPVDRGDTSCKTPYAPEYIAKIMARGKIGVKRKTARC